MDNSDPQKLETCKIYLDATWSAQQFAERRSSELADEFTRLEVQIATILIGFTGIFSSFFGTKVEGINISENIQFLLKLIYSLNVFFLSMSLVLGLIHIKRKEKFWDEIVEERGVLFKKWRSIFENQNIVYKDIKQFHDGATSCKGPIMYSPKWTWVIQTACLGIAFFSFFCLFLVLLFKS